MYFTFFYLLIFNLILVKSDNFVFVPGEHGIPKKMSDCVSDFHAYWRLGEYLIKQIENSTSVVSNYVFFCCCSYYYYFFIFVIVIFINNNYYCCSYFCFAVLL